MAIAMGTNFTRSRGSHLVDDQDLKGGFRVVNSIAERNAIALPARRQGMIVRVVTTTGFEDWTLPHGKPITDLYWEKASLGGGGDFIPTNGGPLKGSLKMELNGSFDFNGQAQMLMLNNNVAFITTAVQDDDDPEPVGMLVFNNGVENTIEINPRIGQIVAKSEVGISSDRSLKKDIRRIENSLSITRRIYGYTFAKLGGKRRYVGLVAQELAQVMPEATTRTEDGKLAVFYGSLAGLFVENIHDLETAISELNKRVDELDERTRYST